MSIIATTYRLSVLLNALTALLGNSSLTEDRKMTGKGSFKLCFESRHFGSKLAAQPKAARLVSTASEHSSCSLVEDEVV